MILNIKDMIKYCDDLYKLDKNIVANMKHVSKILELIDSNDFMTLSIHCDTIYLEDHPFWINNKYDPKIINKIHKSILNPVYCEYKPIKIPSIPLDVIDKL
jgi:hypothetical protein